MTFPANLPLLLSGNKTIFSHEHWMEQALILARQAESLGEVPVGAVLVKDDAILGSGYNQPIHTHDPSAHAEIIALRDAASKIENYRLVETTLYVTIEPCTMCVGALLHARVRKIVFGAREPKAGAVLSHLRLLDGDGFNHRIEYLEGVCESQCSSLIRDFFKAKRK